MGLLCGTYSLLVDIAVEKVASVSRPLSIEASTSSCRKHNMISGYDIVNWVTEPCSGLLRCDANTVTKDNGTHTYSAEVIIFLSPNSNYCSHYNVSCS